MGLKSTLKSYTRLIRLARKPGISELWRTIKICSLGILGIGLIGFIIKLLSLFIKGVFGG